MSAPVLQVAGSRNPSEADLKKNGGGSSIKIQWGVGEAKGSRASQRMRPGMEDGNRREYLYTITFLCFFPYVCFILPFQQLAFLLRPAATIPRAKLKSHKYKSNVQLSSTFFIHLEGCQVFLVHSTMVIRWGHIPQHGCEVGVIVSSVDTPKGIHFILDLSYSSHFSLCLVWPNSCSVLALHCQLLLSSLTLKVCTACRVLPRGKPFTYGLWFREASMRAEGL